MRGLEHISANSSKVLAFAAFALLGIPAQLEGRAVLAVSDSRSITQTDLIALAFVTLSASLFCRVGPGLRAAVKDADFQVLAVLALGPACLYVYLGDGARWLCLLAGVAAYGAVRHALRDSPSADQEHLLSPAAREHREKDCGDDGPRRRATRSSVPH